MNTTNVFSLSLPTGDIELCSVVASDEEYVAFIVKIVECGLADSETVRKLLESKHIPLIERGSRTEPLFQYCGVTTQHMSVIVRGHGVAAFERAMGGADHSVN